MKSGVLNLNKPAGMTSHDAVDRVRRLFGTRKVGHTGTLDPMATGVLPVLVGNAVKASEYLLAENKIYRAELRFGALYDTEDIWGKKNEENDLRPEADGFFRACAVFPKEYDQIPPMTSALKVGGKKLYEYARAGIEIPRAARRVTVEKIEPLSFSGDGAAIRVFCSKGTYIRTLVKDLCASIGVLGAMSALCREKSGAFSLENAVAPEELEKMAPGEREALLLPTEKLFEDLPRLSLAAFPFHLVENGQAISCEKYFPARDFSFGKIALYNNKEEFFALGEIRPGENGKELKKIKTFPAE